MVIKSFASLRCACHLLNISRRLDKFGKQIVKMEFAARLLSLALGKSIQGPSNGKRRWILLNTTITEASSSSLELVVSPANQLGKRIFSFSRTPLPWPGSPLAHDHLNTACPFPSFVPGPCPANKQNFALCKWFPHIIPHHFQPLSIIFALASLFHLLVFPSLRLETQVLKLCSQMNWGKFQRRVVPWAEPAKTDTQEDKVELGNQLCS